MRTPRQFLRNFLAFALCLGFSASAFAEVAMTLPAAVRSAMQNAAIPEDALGVVAFRLKDGAPILNVRADQRMQPASTLKTLISIVALERLGPTYRGTVELRSLGGTEGGTFFGALILRGKGSVDFSHAELRALLQSARDKGIKNIVGAVLIERNWWSPARPEVGVPPFDETPEFRYNVIPDALGLNTNLLQFRLDSDGLGFRARIAPPFERVRLTTNMALVDRKCADWEDGWKTPIVRNVSTGADVGDSIDSLEIVLHGEFPKDCSATTEINVLDRADFVDRAFRALWRELGGEFTGEVIDAAEPISADTWAKTTLIATHRSRTLAEFVRDINKRSDNPIARTAFLALGKLNGTNALEPTTRAAERVVREWLKQTGIDDTGIVLDNGSGLSRSERISPAQLAAVLRAAHKSPWSAELMASLPIVGVDGAMRQRLHKTAALNLGRIKTGGLRDVASIAGYVPDANGELCVIVAMINHPLAARRIATPILDMLAEWVIASRVAP